MTRQSAGAGPGALAGAVGEALGRVPGVDWEPMCVYATALAEVPEGGRAPSSVDVAVERVADLSDVPASATVDAEPSDVVAVARRSEDDASRGEGSRGAVVGWAFARVDAPVRVRECVRPLAFEGAYVWGLYVDPSVRGQGVGTALVAAVTARVARDRYGAAFALVARSNATSRQLFERVGYECVGETARVSVFGRRPPTHLVLGARTYADHE